MSDEQQTPQPDILRIRYGFWIVVIGFVVVMMTLILAVELGGWHDVKDVTTVLSPVAGIVGSLAGAFFGVHVGAQGKERAENERQTAQKQLLNLAAAVQPEIAKRALNLPE